MHPHILKFSSKNGEIRPSIAKNLFIFIACIIQGKTVNLNELKDEVGKITEKHKTSSEGHYKRLTRFLLKNCTSRLWFYLLEYGLELLNKKIDLCYLDATEWLIGSSKIHILVLAMDYQGIAIPVYFEVYAHKGPLSEHKRMKFLKDATDSCPLTNCTIIADREFIGCKWFRYFDDLNLKFVIRIRKKMFKNNLLKGRSYTFLQKRALKKGKASELIQIEELSFRLWVIHKPNTKTKEPFIYILTNILDKKKTTKLYRLRWKVELLFKHLKTNGYNLEDLRVTDLNKIRLIFSMLTLAFIFATLTAIDERKQKSTQQKTYADGRTFDAISVFKQGQSLLKQRFITLTRFLDLVQFLNVTLKTRLPFDLHFVQ